MRGKSTATPKSSQKKASTTAQSSTTGSQSSRSKSGQQLKCHHDSADKKKDTTSASAVPQCEECGAHITDAVSALQCDRCERDEAWKCLTCLGLSENVYQELISSSDLKWFCQECNGKSVHPTDYSANNNLDTILDKVNHLLTIFNDWESRLTERVRAEVNSRLDIETQQWKSVVEKLDDKVRAEVTTQLDIETQHWKFAAEKLEDRIDKYEMKFEAQRSETYAKVIACDSKISNMLKRDTETDGCTPGCSSVHTDHEHNLGNRQVKAIIEEAVNQQQLEDKEIDARKNNLVLYNIPENVDARHDVRLAMDKKFIMTMCNDVAGVEITEDDISKCIRLGAFEDGKTRPILLGVASECTKDSIMKMGKDLGLSGNRYNKIGIAHDYTPKQREENRKLLAEVKAAIIADGDQPENYKLYVIRRNSRAEVIKKKRIKPKQAPQTSAVPQQPLQQPPPAEDI